MYFRVIYSLVYFMSIFFLPFWVSVLIGIASMIFFRKYYEVLIFFFIFDLLYAVKIDIFSDFVFVTFIAGVLLFIIIEFIKDKLRFDFKI